jgi:hypothetical protein
MTVPAADSVAGRMNTITPPMTIAPPMANNAIRIHVPGSVSQLTTFSGVCTASDTVVANAPTPVASATAWAPPDTYGAAVLRVRQERGGGRGRRGQERSGPSGYVDHGDQDEPDLEIFTMARALVTGS